MNSLHATVTPRPALHPHAMRPMRGARPAEPDSGNDALRSYLTRIGRHPLLGADQEVAAATELRQRKHSYWLALLAEDAVVQALAELPDGALEPGPWSAAHAAMQAGDRDAAPELAQALVDADPDMVVADRFAADLASLAAGERRGLRGAFAGIEHDVRPTLARARAASAAVRATKERFVAANLRLVVKTATSYDHGALPLSDLIQEGNLGLMKAVDRFDHRLGFRFSTYATWWIRHALSRAVANHGRTVRVPAGVRQIHARMSRVSGRLATELGRAATTAELAAAMAQSEERLAIASTAMITPISLETPLGGDDGVQLRDTLSDEDAHTFADELDGERSARLLQAISALEPIEAEILRRRFGLDGGEEQTLQEIAALRGLSRERIRQLQTRALAKLRRKLKAR